MNTPRPVGARFALRQFLTVGLTLRGIENADVADGRGGNEQAVRYGRIDARVSWRCTENWALSLLLAASTQQSGSDAPWAENYRAQVGMVWTGRALQL